MDSFKEQIENATRDARQKHLEEIENRKKLDLQHRANLKAAVEKAEAFCDRVINPVLVDFSSAAATCDFVREFNESDSQPTFTYSCEINDERLYVEVLFWVAGSAEISCDFGFRTKDTPLRIESFDQKDIDETCTAWLKAKLIEKYKSLLKKSPGIFTE